MEQKRLEIHAPEPGGGSDKGSEGADGKNLMSTSGTESSGEAARVRGI